LFVEYIILDDLSNRFRKPNICDIKIGTRQHGDDVAADKKIRHSNKVKTTTSQPLGLRMCGIQVFISHFFLLFISFFRF
jgi:inositol-hexakisphosphate kinase